MARILLLVTAIALVACGGAVEPGGIERADGLLVVEAPVSRILATFGVPPPTAHTCDPPMWLAFSEGGCRRADGCLIFAPERAAEVYTIDSWIPATGEPLCPLEVVVEH